METTPPTFRSFGKCHPYPLSIVEKDQERACMKLIVLKTDNAANVHLASTQANQQVV